MDYYSDEILIKIMKVLFDIHISKADLNKPVSTATCKIYSFFLRDFGMNINALYEIPITANVCVHEHPELYSDFIYQVKLSKVIGWLVKSLKGNLNFYLKDVITPDPIRTRKFFSLFLNFYEVIHSNVDVLSEMESKVDQKVKDFEDLKEKIETYKNKISKREIDNIEDELEINEVKENIHILKGDLLEKKDMNERLKGRVNGIKDEIITIKLSVGDMNNKLLQRKEDLTTLSSQVCTTNECEEYEQMKGDVLTLKSTNEEIHKNINNIKKKKEHFKDNLESLQNLSNGPLQKLEHKLEEKLALEKELKDAKSGLFARKQELNKWNDRSNELSETISSVKSEVEAIKLLKETNIEPLKREIDLQKETLALLKKSHTKEDEENNKLQDQINGVKELIAKATAKMNNFMKNYELCLIKLDAKVTDD